MTAEIVGVSLSVEPASGCYIPFGHRYAGAPAQLQQTFEQQLGEQEVAEVVHPEHHLEAVLRDPHDVAAVSVPPETGPLA